MEATALLKRLEEERSLLKLEMKGPALLKLLQDLDVIIPLKPGPLEEQRLLVPSRVGEEHQDRHAPRTDAYALIAEFLQKRKSDKWLEGVLMYRFRNQATGSSN